jgi:putative amidase-like protein
MTSRRIVMTIDRNAALEYAKKYWNRVTDDDKFWTSNAVVSLAAKRKSMNAPAAEGWEAFFVSNHDRGEDAVFRRTVGGNIEQKPDPIATWDDLDDCTHYVCRCLIKEGISLKETPRANELAEAMLKSKKTKTLALKTTREQGQKVIDSGMFKPGDLVAYYTEEKGRYTHTAMFVGKQTGHAHDLGGITCHTVCRFEGLTETWNGATDDRWFLHEEGLSYTLIHFSEDDADISASTLEWLPGWWQVEADFYYVSENGRALSTASKPKTPGQKLSKSESAGYYFEENGGIVFVWRKPAGEVQVERWTAPTGVKTAALSVDGSDANLTRVF